MSDKIDERIKLRRASNVQPIEPLKYHFDKPNILKQVNGPSTQVIDHEKD